MAGWWLLSKSKSWNCSTRNWMFTLFSAKWYLCSSFKHKIPRIPFPREKITEEISLKSCLLVELWPQARLFFRVYVCTWCDTTQFIGIRVSHCKQKPRRKPTSIMESSKSLERFLLNFSNLSDYLPGSYPSLFPIKNHQQKNLKPHVVKKLEKLFPLKKKIETFWSKGESHEF